MQTVMFVDRVDAGLQLSEALAGYKGSSAVVLAIPRGGVPVAAEVARALHLPLDILLTKKIGHPAQPELAIGAVSLLGTLLDPTFPVPPTYIAQEEAEIRALLRRRETMYRSGRPAIPLAGRTVILIDDGIATGYTMRAAIELARQAKARKVVVAVPVAAGETVDELRTRADEVTCLEIPDRLYAIGAHYEDFTQVSDEEVVRLLNEAASRSNGDDAPPKR